jgi:hypothetical protein
MVGNSDSTIYSDGSGPGNSIGLRYMSLGSDYSVQVGNYYASDRPDETSANHVKDNNWRGLAIYNGNLYIAKGSGGNGDNGVFQVTGTGSGLPVTSGASFMQLLGGPATDPTSGAAGIYTPYGFWFANDKTLYVADEGNIVTDKSGNLVPDPLVGLQKWIQGSDGTWKLAYTIQNGLNMGTWENVTGYAYPTTTYGLRALTGKLNPDGTATLYALSFQYSSISKGTADPNKLVMVTDPVSAATLPTADSFSVLQVAEPGQVFRGIAWAPRK